MDEGADEPAPLVRVPLQAVRGRGAASRIAHRFAREARDRLAGADDGWPGDAHADDAEDTEDAQAAPPLTEVLHETARSALCRNDSPDIPFIYSVNPYRGCEHGCIYCYARPTHSYLNLSPGLDFETRIVAKTNIAAVLRRELARPGHVPSALSLGSATDCYQPVERTLRLTRGLIEVLRDARHPFGLITKSSGVERDIDLLAPLAERRLVAVYVTLTTLDAELARRLEPRAAAPHRRLRTIATLAAAGIPVGVSVAPQIPFLNEDMEQVLDAAYAAGARSAFYSVLRLPWELDALFREWLELHYPQRAARIMARVQDLHGISAEERQGACRTLGVDSEKAPRRGQFLPGSPPHSGAMGQEAGEKWAAAAHSQPTIPKSDRLLQGKSYTGAFATRMHGSGHWADLLRQRFALACRRLGMNRTPLELDYSQFRPALARGQGCLF